MKYRVLGKSGLAISEIGFGCMSLKGEEKENLELVQSAIDAGINFFDTADIYARGENESQLGRALQKKRKNIILATKVGNVWRNDGKGLDWNPGKQHILQAVEKSLVRLKTDYIDLYQLHGGTIDDPIDETIEAFELLRGQGKILHYGLSSIRPNVIREYVMRSSIVSNMLQYSLLDRRPEEDLLKLLAENEIGILARGSIAQGILIDKPAREYLDYTPEEVEKACGVIRSLAAGDRSPTQLVIGYVLKHPAIRSAVAGIRTLKQLTELVTASAGDLPDDDEMVLLKKAIKPNYYSLHR